MAPVQGRFASEKLLASSGNGVNCMSVLRRICSTKAMRATSDLFRKKQGMQTARNERTAHRNTGVKKAEGKMMKLIQTSVAMNRSTSFLRTMLWESYTGSSFCAAMQQVVS